MSRRRSRGRPTQCPAHKTKPLTLAPVHDIRLITALQAAVPLHIMDLAALPDRVRDSIRIRWADEAVNPVAAHGDTLMYGDKPGEAAAVFNALARGLAAAAFQPGGITTMGQHWCVNHTKCVEAAAYAERINACPVHGPERPPARTVDTVQIVGVS